MPDTRDDFDVRHVAALARLRLTPHEEVLYQKQLAEILAFARTILAVDTPLSAGDGSAAARPEPIRADEVQPSLDVQHATAQAPDSGSHAEWFRVPRVIG